MTNLVEGLRTGEHLFTEANGYRSREQVSLAAGTYQPGHVLGRTVGAAVAASAAVPGSTGNGVMGAVNVAADAIQGAYLLKVTKAAVNAGDFEVIDPRGEVCGIGSVGAPFVGGGLSFTLADGATDFALNDSFRITVAAPVATWKAFDPTATDGSQKAGAVLLAGAVMTGQGRGVAHVRACEMNGLLLTWPVGISTAAKSQAIADLAGAGIIIRF